MHAHTARLHGFFSFISVYVITSEFGDLYHGVCAGPSQNEETKQEAKRLLLLPINRLTVSSASIYKTHATSCAA